MIKTPPWVDCQSHVFPPAYAEWLKQHPGAVRVSGGEGIYHIDYGGVQQFTLRLADYDPRHKIAQMDAAGIDISVISVNIPGPDVLPPEFAVAGARLCNDYLAEVCAQHPGRFVGLASLPLPDVDAAIAEVDRAIDELDLRGVMLLSHIAGQPPDAPAFRPLYQHLATCGLPLVLHPTVPTWGSAVQAYSMIPMVGFMMDTSIAMLRLILSGVMEANPGLQVVHPHCGGVLPYLMGRVTEQTEVKRRGRDFITQPPAATYDRVYLDTVSPAALPLRYAYEFAGADRLLFGSDHPWVSIQSLLALVQAMTIPEHDKAKILGLNACKLFRIKN
jgi:predicted TIM-barrel fold metal-dependent hydrolase